MSASSYPALSSAAVFAQYVADVIFPKCSSAMRAWQHNQSQTAESAHHNSWHTNAAGTNTAESAPQSLPITTTALSRSESAPNTLWSQTDSWDPPASARRSESERPPPGCRIFWDYEGQGRADYKVRRLAMGALHGNQDMAQEPQPEDVVRAWNRVDVNRPSQGGPTWQHVAVERLRNRRPEKRLHQPQGAFVANPRWQRTLTSPMSAESPFNIMVGKMEWWEQRLHIINHMFDMASSPRDDPGTVTYVAYYREKLRTQCWIAEAVYEDALRDGLGDPGLLLIQKKLCGEYYKWWILHGFHFMIIEGKDGARDRYKVMSSDQRSEEVRLHSLEHDCPDDAYEWGQKIVAVNAERIRIAAAKFTAARVESAPAASAPTAVNATSPRASSICSFAVVGSTEPRPGTAEEQHDEDDDIWISVDAVVPAPTGVEDNRAASARPELVPEANGAPATDAAAQPTDTALRTTQTGMEQRQSRPVPNASASATAGAASQLSPLEANNNEMRLLIRQRLIDGIPSWYKVKGKYLQPGVKPGQWLLFKPVADKRCLFPGQIVFCQLPPGDHLYAQYIARIDHWTGDGSDGSARRRFVIGSNNTVDGICDDRHILGLMTRLS